MIVSRLQSDKGKSVPSSAGPDPGLSSQVASQSPHPPVPNPLRSSARPAYQAPKKPDNAPDTGRIRPSAPHRSSRTKSGSGSGRYPDGCVISKADIRALIDKTTYSRVIKICAMMVGVIEACFTAYSFVPSFKLKAELDPKAIRLIKALSRLDSDPELKSILLLIEESIYDGSRGIAAAENTAREITDYTFRDTPEWDSLTRDLEKMLREAGLKEFLIDVRKIAPLS